MATGGHRIDIAIEGAQQTRNKVGQFGTKFLPQERRELLEDVSRYTLAIAREGAPKDLGFGARNMFAEVTEYGAVVVTPDAYMVTQELGRKPNSPAPPVHHLVGWGARHGFVGYRALVTLSRSIGRKGWPPKLFMARAAAAGQVYLNKRVAVSKVRIETWWNSGN